MANIQLPNTPAYKVRVDTCNSCENIKDKHVLGMVIPVCGLCNCPIKTKCVAGPCPAKPPKWS